ncbi:hypothetical protein GCM10007907_17680 [Chitinimonas prasina]|uniref:Uncharacterized protein n=1 Tax=Chitinimonas prasina TaxID=1434937 RepID=A0ABQ5YG52_9NEIS|nr:hypothetical protein GCM10007907_17680 [Chitinimonas prasina]
MNGDIFLFRGTSPGWAGNPGSQATAASASVDTYVATVFALEARGQVGQGVLQAQVFSVGGNPLIKEVQYSPSTAGLPLAERSQHVGEYYKFTYNDGSKVKVINPETYKMGSPEKNTDYFNQQGRGIVYDPATRTWRLK